MVHPSDECESLSSFENHGALQGNEMLQPSASSLGGLDLDEQRAQVSAHRHGLHMQQLQRWEEESKALQNFPKQRILCLLAEAYSRELRNCEQMLKTGAIDLPTFTARVQDVKRGYASLRAEVERALSVRRGSVVAQREVMNSAMSSFSSIFPWSGSVLCSEIDLSDPKYSRHVQQKQLCPATNGAGALVLSFAATNAVSTTKVQAAATRKMNVLLACRAPSQTEQCYDAGDFY